MPARPSSQILFFTQLIPELFRDPISCQFILSCHSAGDPPRNYEMCWSQMSLCSLSQPLWSPFESAGRKPRDRACGWVLGNSRSRAWPFAPVVSPVPLRPRLGGYPIVVAGSRGWGAGCVASQRHCSVPEVGAGRDCDGVSGGTSLPVGPKIWLLAPFGKKLFNEAHWRRPAPTLPRKPLPSTGCRTVEPH